MKIFPKSSAVFPSQIIVQNGIIGSHLKKSFTRERNDWLGFYIGITLPVGFPGGSLVKNLPGNARDAGYWGSILGSGRFPGEGKGNPL